MYTGPLEAKTDGGVREGSVPFDTGETFLLGCGEDLTITDQSRGGIVVIRGYSKNVYGLTHVLRLGSMSTLSLFWTAVSTEYTRKASNRKSIAGKHTVNLRRQPLPQSSASIGFDTS